MHACVAGILFLVINPFDDYLQDVPYNELIVVGAIPVIAFLFRQSDAIARLIIEGVPGVSPLLRRVLLGKEDIEGDWPLVVVDVERREPVYFGFLTIRFKDGQFQVFGDDWLPDTGEHAMSFRAIQSRYANSRLQYWYEQGTSLQEPEMRGYTELYFFPADQKPLRHCGEFLDKEHHINIRFYAEKHIYARGEKPITDRERKIALGRQVWERMTPRLDHILQRKISSDWM